MDDLTCRHSECARRRIKGRAFCLPHHKAFMVALGHMKDEQRRRFLIAHTRSLHDATAHEVAKNAAGGEMRPRRYTRYTNMNPDWFVQGGLPERDRGKF